MSMGEKTKLLWQNPEYRKHMSVVHKGHKVSPESILKQKLSRIRNNKIRIKKPLTYKQLEVLRKMSESHIGKHLSEEHKKKLSAIHKGKVISIEQREKLRQANLGKRYSEETKMKHRLSALGKVQSEETRRKHSEAQKGSKSNKWKGGISPLVWLLRSSFETKEWSKKVFKRDNYTCQECFKRGGKLHSHHIKAFSIILKEFLQEYNQFSPIEDKETLIRLAITYQPFWDISNGMTLCKNCHLVTNNYGNTRTIKEKENA
jgi:hypothetical protein